MSIPRDYNLKNLISEYSQHLNGDNTPQEDPVRDRLVKVIAMGAGKLDSDQEDALIKFSSRFSEKFPEDKAVQVATDVANSILMNRESIPKNIKTILRTFQDVTELQSLSDDELKQAASLASTRILQAAKEGKPLKKSDLVQFTKIISVCWDDDAFVDETKDELSKALTTLVKNEQTTSELKQIAMPLIKQTEGRKTPRDVIELPGYHGTALKEGIEAFQSRMKESGKAEVSLLALVTQYCNDHLKKREYLIRQSASVPSQDEKNSTYTITFKRKSGGLYSFRLTRTEDETGRVSWKKQNPLPKEKIKSYGSIQALLAKELPEYKASKLPSTAAINTYFAVFDDDEL